MTDTNKIVAPTGSISIPFVLEKSAEGERSYDLASRMMQERIIMIDIWILVVLSQLRSS